MNDTPLRVYLVLPKDGVSEEDMKQLRSEAATKALYWAVGNVERYSPSKIILKDDYSPEYHGMMINPIELSSRLCQVHLAIICYDEWSQDIHPVIKLCKTVGTPFKYLRPFGYQWPLDFLEIQPQDMSPYRYGIEERLQWDKSKDLKI